jgi:hypothetical protein
VVFLTSEKNWLGKIFRADYRKSQCFERGKMKGLSSKIRVLIVVLTETFVTNSYK